MSAQSILIDVDNSTFLIGALPKDSFLSYHFSPGNSIPSITFAIDSLKLASPMTWIENFLNITNSYYKVTTSNEDDQFKYLVPFPPGFTGTMKAYWTTDVIVLDPSCSWQTVIIPQSDSGPGAISWNLTTLQSNLTMMLDFELLSMFILPSNVSYVYSISSVIQE